MRILAAVAFVAGLLAVTSFSEAQPPGKDKKGGPGGKGGKAASVEDMVARLMAYDKNKDDKLTKEELSDGRLQALFERADADKDGVVTKAELTALLTKEAAAIASGPGEKGPGGPGGKGDKGPPPGGKGIPPPKQPE